MQLPLQITWRGIKHSDAAEAQIREKAEKLDQFYDRIMGCRVMVESPHEHHHKGNLFHIRIDITVPGGEIVVRRSPEAHSAHEDIYVVIRDAFDAARRQLQDYARKQRGEIKRHDIAHTATVLRKFPAQGYGFLLTPDNREIYFHKNSLTDADFDFLHEGTVVHYVEEQGDEGPQAQKVILAKEAEALE